MLRPIDPSVKAMDPSLLCIIKPIDPSSTFKVYGPILAMCIRPYIDPSFKAYDQSFKVYGPPLLY